MKKCIVENCNEKTKGNADSGIDDLYYCEKHKLETRKKRVNDSRNVIRNVAKKVIK